MQGLFIAMWCLASTNCAGTDDGALLSAEGLRYEQQVPLPSRNVHRQWPGFAVGNGSIVVADVDHSLCNDDGNGTEDCGVSIIERSNAAWAQTGFFEDPDLGAIEMLATNGETVVLGHESIFSTEVVFHERVGSEWSPTLELTHGAGTNAIAIERDTAVVAENWWSGESVLGLVTVLERREGSWVEAQVLRSSDGVYRFGGADSIDLDEDTLIVGDFESERAHVFERIDGEWEETAVLTSPDREQNRYSSLFGFSVAASGNRVAVGAAFEQPPAVYVFERDRDGSWGLSARVLASNTSQHHKPDQPVVKGFGESVALHGGLLLVGARAESSYAVGINNPIPPTQADTNTGAAYLFEHVEGAWEERYYIKVADSYKLGTRVALDHERVWVAGLDSIHVWRHGEP
jgi:hypothetical protein